MRYCTLLASQRRDVPARQGVVTYRGPVQFYGPHHPHIKAARHRIGLSDVWQEPTERTDRRHHPGAQLLGVSAEGLTSDYRNCLLTFRQHNVVRLVITIDFNEKSI